MYKYEVLNLESIDSTQTYLINKDKNLSLCEFFTVYTSNQSAGKGQGEHKWESEKDKNICFSFVLHPVFIDPSDQYIITQIISLAILRTLREYDINGVKIKWPNDIYVNNKKICGMLIQNKILGREFSVSYVGIGINVNQKIFSFAPNPTSFALEKNGEFNKEEVFQKVMQNIIGMYLEYKKGKSSNINKKYSDNLLFLNEYRKYNYKGKETEFRIIDVNPYGHLILKDREQKQHIAELREIEFIF